MGSAKMAAMDKDDAQTKERSRSRFQERSSLATHLIMGAFDRRIYVHFVYLRQDQICLGTQDDCEKSKLLVVSKGRWAEYLAKGPLEPERTLSLGCSSLSLPIVLEKD